MADDEKIEVTEVQLEGGGHFPRASKDLKIEYIIPAGFGVMFSDQAYIQSTSTEFIISFFQTEHPLIQSKEDLEALEAIRAFCVSRIVVTPPQMAKLFKAMHEAILKHQAMHGKQKEGDEK